MCTNIKYLVLLVAVLPPNIFTFPIVLDNTKFCDKNPCLPKCCDSGEIFNSTSLRCINSTKEYDFKDMPVYEAYIDGARDLKKISKTLGDIWHHMLPRKLYQQIDENTTFVDYIPMVGEDYNLKTYFTETGELYFANLNGDLLKADDFCIDYVVKNQEKVAQPRCAFINFDSFTGNNETDVERGTKHHSYLEIVSSVFLAIVLFVYALLPELRNLAGKILMAYVFSLMMFFILLPSLLSTKPNLKEECIKITASMYFFILSSFCWMNIMSVDIWWTFRGYAKARMIHRHGENFKFLVYCLYGWVLPIFVTGGLVLVNNNGEYLSRWIVTPQIPTARCFIDGKPKHLYLHVPMTIIIASNWLFFLMTAYNIRRLMRGTAVLNSAAAGNPAAHQQQRNRLSVYLKLSVIMGVNWLLEVLSALDLPGVPKEIWIITDIYNLFIGVAIFLIFVCKKKIYMKLKTRFHTLRGIWPNSQETT